MLGVSYMERFVQALSEKAKSVAGVQQWPYKAVASALEVIPRTLIQNCGANTIRTITALRVSRPRRHSRLTQHYSAPVLYSTNTHETGGRIDGRGTKSRQESKRPVDSSLSQKQSYPLPLLLPLPEVLCPLDSSKRARALWGSDARWIRRSVRARYGVLMPAGFVEARACVMGF